MNILHSVNMKLDIGIAVFHLYVFSKNHNSYPFFFAHPILFVSHIQIAFSLKPLSLKESTYGHEQNNILFPNQILCLNINVGALK